MSIAKVGLGGLRYLFGKGASVAKKILPKTAEKLSLFKKVVTSDEYKKGFIRSAKRIEQEMYDPESPLWNFRYMY